MGTYSAKIGFCQNPSCWWCGQAEQSVEHLGGIHQMPTVEGGKTETNQELAGKAGLRKKGQQRC